MKSSPLYLFLKKPWVAGFLTFIILLFVSQYMAYQKYLINENEQKKEIDNHVNLIKEKLQSLVMFSYSATKSLAYIVERSGVPADFDTIAIELLGRNKYFNVLELVDENGFITHVYPSIDNQVVGYNILENTLAGKGAYTPIKKKDFFIDGPVNLKQGGVGIVSRQPIFIDKKFSGFSAVVTKLSDFFNDLNITASHTQRFIYQLSRLNPETGREEFFLEHDMASFKPFAVNIEMFEGKWKLYVVSTKQKFNTGIWFAIYGFTIAIGGSWIVYFFFGQSERLEKFYNAKLVEQETQLRLIYKTTESKIKKSESNLNKAQKVAKLGSWELDLKKNELSWSKEMYRIFEKDPKKFEASQAAFYDIVHPEDKDMVFKIFTDAVKNNKSYQIIYRLDIDKERIKYVEEQCETSYDENQVPEKAFGTVQDITDRKKIETVLKNSELMYRSLTSYAPVVIFNIDKSGKCTYLNEEWIRYSGMTYAESMGLGWQNALHPLDKDRVLSEWQEAFLTNSEFKSEFRIQDKKGEIRNLSAKATKLLDANNEMVGHIGIASDITDRIKNEKELLVYKNNLEELVNQRTEELNDSKEALLNLLEDLNEQSIELEKEKIKAQSADLMKSSFLATMSHELRTPMNSIIGFTSILLKGFAGPLNEEQAKQIGMVKKSGQHLLGLINDILDISKIEAGELKVSSYPFNFGVSLQKTIDFLLPQALKKGLIIEYERYKTDVTLTSDERRVEQVLLNLISNAIKFSYDGVIRVKVDVKDNMLTTQVIDQGIGISKANLNKLFVPFIQLEGGLSRSHEGSGLGLAISKNLMDKLGGTIQVKSELGKGSTFTIALPIN
ncbi:ATP-binding protein [Mariniflexile ostreae]|uniref:histidine kinase n=1 Tax=Mariniflexile ostreae TaxID=1520892 RepID=A0ABV5F871_9FLAO